MIKEMGVGDVFTAPSLAVCHYKTEHRGPNAPPILDRSMAYFGKGNIHTSFWTEVSGDWERRRSYDLDTNAPDTTRASATFVVEECHHESDVFGPGDHRSRIIARRLDLGGVYNKDTERVSFYLPTEWESRNDSAVCDITIIGKMERTFVAVNE